MRIIALLLFAGLWALLAGFLGESRSAQSGNGHERMLQLLQQVKARADVENHYTGDGGRREVEAQLAALPADAPDLTRFRVNCLASIHDMRLGHTEEAIQHLLEAFTLLPKVRQQVPKEIAEETTLQLGVAYLRLGETQNCIHHRTSESCLLPIRGSGVHSQQGGARRAISYFSVLLKENPDHLTARWLLNIAYMSVGEYPAGVPKRFLIPPEAFKSEEDFPKFENIASDVGLDIVGLAGGAIADDFDGDGLLDIVVSDWDSAGQIRYFRNKGDGTFSEQTADAGLTGLYGGLYIVQADYDNDGDLDILVPRGAWLEAAGRHPKSLLRNDGHGHFRDVTFEAGLGEVHYPSQIAAWADYDNDGDLDLFAGNEKFPSQLFKNNGGIFTDVARQAGVENNRFAKGAVWGDYNNDRFPDLYVSNMEDLNRLYRNNRDGTFTDVAPQLGVTKPLRSFPTWFWDFNNDGVLDLFVASYHPDVRHVAADYLGLPHEGEPACLYQGDGKGGFREVAASQNLTRVAHTMGSNFGDLDNDGYPDFYLGTGYPAYEALMPNLLFRNRGGTGFSNVTTAANVGHLQKGHGVSFADLDNDGDQDIFSKVGGSLAGDVYTSALFQNPGFGHHWLTIKLVGKQSNRSAIGARIRAEINESGKQHSIYKWVNTGGSFGANPLRQEIGLGKATVIETLEIFWPTTGKAQHFRNVPADQFVEITEGESQYRKLPWKSVKFRRLNP
jgi:tetratricopeptide (TPR) repeat protein